MPLATSRPSPRLPAKAMPSASVSRGRAKVVDVPFEMRTLATKLGTTWDPVRKVHLWRGEGELPDLLKAFASAPYSWERMQEDELNDLDVVEKAPAREIVLRAHQKKASEAISAAVKAGRGGFLNADDVGLGKTIETWDAVRKMGDAESVLIVCPLSVVAHWRRTIEWMGDAGKRIVVINYDRLKKLFEAPPPKPAKKGGKVRKIRTQKGLARQGTAAEFDVVIFDEAHRLRNPLSARSQFSLKLSAPADFIMWLSATAGTTPLELAYLAPLLSETTGTRSSDLKDFEEWCKKQDFGVSRGKFGKWTWAGNDKEASDTARNHAIKGLDKMRSMLFDGHLPLGIRRRPSDIEGWPEVNRIPLPVELDAEDRASYAKIWNEFRDHLGLERRGASNSTNNLVARLRFRQKASLLRTSSTLDLALELLGQGQQVAISVGFHETLDILKEAFANEDFNVAVIDGRLGAAEKEQRRLDFQHGRSTVCLYTVEEGISLHQGEYNEAPRSNLIHDLRWSAIQMKQIEGRTHRDGRFSQVYWMMAVDTIEEEIASIVAGRIVSMSTMQGDGETIADVDKLLSRMSA